MLQGISYQSVAHGTKSTHRASYFKQHSLAKHIYYYGKASYSAMSGANPMKDRLVERYKVRKEVHRWNKARIEVPQGKALLFIIFASRENIFSSVQFIGLGGIR